MASELKPFLSEHADEIIAIGLNDKLMEIDASYSENRICDHSQEGNAFTMFVNGKPAFACGIVVLKADFKLGLRLATWCGLEVEGLKKKYGPDGSDYYQLGKIY